MRRVAANPPNPYESAYREWLGEPPQVRVEVYEEHAKSILATNDSPDVSFTWSVNPYRGCQHSCAYCYARPTHEYLGLGAGTDFDSKITAKVNAPELLEAALSRKSWKHENIAFSGVTDCYQPLESVYELTKRCLEVCVNHRNPAGVVTKSFLVARDADLLARLASVARCAVYFSIPFADDDEPARQIEHGAPPPSRRFEAMKRLHDAGVPVGVMMAPIIPGLNDRDIARVLERAAECGATRAGYNALRLPGSVKDVFLARLRERLPLHAARVEARIRDMRGGALSDPRFGSRMEGSGVYWGGVKQLFDKTVQRLGLNQHDAAGEIELAHTDGPFGRDTQDRGTGLRQLPLFPADAREMT
jgi:DNA repair photolyase